MYKNILCAAFAFFLFGCGAQSVSDRINLASTLATPYNLTQKIIYTNTFNLTVFQRIQHTDAPVFVYIEGDGFAWVNRHQLSRNPTPKNPVGLRLALIETAPNVLYIARPCQYTLNDPLCDNEEYWSGARFSAEVVDAIEDAITQIAKKRPVHLIGYSGGGAIATLIAAQHKNVLSLRTLAGNLDHVAVNRYHKVSQMPESLNAIDMAEQLATMPQIHFTSSSDKIIPPFIAERFKKSAGKNAQSCITVTVLNAPTHYKGWPMAWKNLYNQMPTCQ